VATGYPGAIDEFTPITPGVPGGSRMSDEIGGRTHADIINDLQYGLVAVQEALGINPQRNTFASTVKFARG
jgi:hypothetical protein